MSTEFPLIMDDGDIIPMTGEEALAVVGDRAREKRTLLAVSPFAQVLTGMTERKLSDTPLPNTQVQED